MTRNANGNSFTRRDGETLIVRTLPPWWRRRALPAVAVSAALMLPVAAVAAPAPAHAATSQQVPRPKLHYHL
jgi:hypothetical protein